ncbi:MAG: TauD/TfdA family dioxygenase [Alphaproteobacteria bacterium]|nr:TauD/TfdA family dioxygenase [Alphaproteobacteria bacterium]
MSNTADKLEVVPTGGPLGAEIRGINFAQPVDDETAAALNEAWAAHSVLLFRSQNISAADHVVASALFGEPSAGANRAYYEAQGRLPTDAVADQPEITVISNLDANGEPVMKNEGLGSGEVVWHSDNSYVETPPAGSFLRALEVPPEGGNTSFNNQYMAYDTLPDDVKDRIQGLHTKQDSSRNSAGVLRQGVKKPETLEDVPGPNHPLVRVHPVTGRKALYLGRRRVFPSQYVMGWERSESEALLDFLWTHATQDRFKWTHGPWRVGDMVLWDNRCVMHYRDAHAGTHRRVMHRTQLGKQAPIMA